MQRAETEGVKKRISELSEFLQNTDTELTEYDEQMVRKYIEQIKVYDEKLTVCFKAKAEDVIRDKELYRQIRRQGLFPAFVE